MAATALTTGVPEQLAMTQRVEGHWLYKATAWGISLFGILLFRLRAYGRENVPARGGVLVACNHQSHLDPPLIGSLTRREVYFMARESLFKNRVFGKIIRFYKAYPVKPNSMGLDAMRNTVQLLKEGRAVMMFPEGRRTPDGDIHDFHLGVIIAAQRAGVPLVPVVIDGAYAAWSRSAWIFNSRQVKIMYGKPIRYDGLDKEEQVAALQSLKVTFERMREQIHGYWEKQEVNRGARLPR